MSTCTDGDNGTNEYGALEFAAPQDLADIDIRSIGWLEKTTDAVNADDQFAARLEGRYLGIGVKKIDDDDDWDVAWDVDANNVPSSDFDGVPGVDDDGDGTTDEETLNGVDDDRDGLVDEDVGALDDAWVQANAADLAWLNDDPTRVAVGDANGDGVFDCDPEPGIDEDPAGDISADNIDNDHDGLFDEDDPDLDGDLVPGDLDDDDDGFGDEDDLATADQELITAYADTCEFCVQSADYDGFTPLGVRVLQHSYQWSGSTGRDSILMEFEVTNIRDTVLEDVCLGTFFDFDVGHLTQNGGTNSEDDITYYVDDIQMAVGADNDGDNGLLAAREFGVRVVETPLPSVQTTYKNFNRLTGGDPEGNLAKYQLMASGERDPDRLDPGDWRFVLAFGPLGDLNPGETLPVTVAILNWPMEQAADPSERPIQLSLGDVHPNPSSGRAELKFSLNKKAQVEITVHDLAGQKVALLENGWLNRGEHSAEWIGRDSTGREVSSGLYFIRIQTGDKALSRPVVLVR